jgi:hypothetical protein
MSEGPTDARPRRGLRWTLGSLMLLVALVAVTLAWYVQRVREFAREQAAADAERALYVSQVNQILKSMDDQAKREQDHWAREIARAQSPPKPSVKSIPEQVKNIVKLLDEQAKNEEKSKRFRAELAAKILARMREKERLEKSSSGGAPAPAATVEQPR